MAGRNKQAGESQVAWALLTEGVSEARVEAHRLRHLMTRALALVEKSKGKEEIYQHAGDIIQTAPRRMENLERILDRTSYALAVFGTDHLRDRLPMSDRALVDDATHRSKPFSGPSTSRVSARYLLSRRADLMPPLGYPGGPCHVVERIRREVRNPRLQKELISDVEEGGKLSNPEAAQVYDRHMEDGPGGKWDKIRIVPHAQFRMDQRQVTVPEVRLALKSFLKALGDEKSRQSPLGRRWESMLERHTPILWVDPTLDLAVVFVQLGPDIVQLVTAYWEGASDPRARGRGSCPVT
jgi:hypothetical protein